MKKTVLAVGESQDFVDIIKYMFSETRSVQCALTADEAVDILESRPVHLIITSAKFEHHSAVDFIFKLRTMDLKIRETPVMLLANVLGSELYNASRKYDIELIQLPVEPISFETIVDDVIISHSKNYEKPDPVTGLIKKQYGEEQIKELLAAGKKGALMLINIDHYSFASAGISVSALLACRDVLKDVITKNAVLAVANKHSFILFVPDLRDRKEIENYGARIIANFNGKTMKEKLYVSIGLSVTDRHGNDYADLYQQCDLGLSVARNSGKNKACFYSW